MAYETIGLGGVLTFDSTQALSGMNKANLGFKGLQASAMRAKASIATMSSGFSSLGMALLPVGIGLGYLARSAYKFEAQMGAVSAVSQASESDMKRLADTAMELGISTVFTATEAAQGLEILARAGFDTQASIDAIGGVLGAAAAEGMGLEQAASIITTVLRGMSLEMSDSQRVADVLALASARTNTSISGLGEGFKYVAMMAASSGVSFEEATAAMGMMSNAGLQSSQSGTAMEAMLKGLLTMTPRAAKAATQLGLSFRNADGSLRPIADIVDNVSAALTNIEDPIKRDQLLFTLFRDTGTRAFRALEAQGTDALRALTTELQDAGDMTDQYGRKVGAASAMAARRLDNLEGAIKLLRSSFQGLGITMFVSFLKPMAGAVLNAVGALNKFLYTLNRLKDTSSGIIDVTALEQEFGRTTVQMALGVLYGFNTLRSAWASVKSAFSEMADKIGGVFGETDTAQIMKWVTVITMAAAALMPLMMGLKWVGMIAGGLVNIISGAGGLLMAMTALLPVLAIVGAALGVFFLAAREDGDSVTDTLLRMKDMTVEFGRRALAVFEAILKPVIEFGRQLGEVLMPAVISFADMLSAVWSNIVSVFTTSGESILAWWRSFASLVSGILLDIADGVTFLFTQALIPAIQQTFGFIMTVVQNLGSVLNMLTVGLAEQWNILSASIRAAIYGLANGLASIFSGVFAILNAVWGFTMRFVNGIREGLASLMGILSDAFSFLGEVFAFVGTIVGWVGEKVAWLINEFSWLADVLSFAFNTIMTVLRPILAAVWEIGRVLMGFVYGVLQAIWSILQPIFSVISAIGKWLWENLKPAFEAIKVVVMGIFDVLGWVYNNIIKPLVDTVGGALTLAFKAVGAVITGIVQGLQWVWDKVSGILGGISQAQGIIDQVRRIKEGQAALDKAAAPKSYVEAAGPATMMVIPSRLPAAAGAIGAERAAQTTPPRPEDTPGGAPTVDANFDITAQTNIDGRCVSSASSRHTRETRERAGFETTPWQRRAAVVRATDLPAPA